jgi:hypothetical protein
MSPVPRERPNRGQIADDAKGQARIFALRHLSGMGHRG